MKRLLLSSLLVITGAFAFAQPCTPNTSYTQPGIYPDTLPSGTVGVPYATDATFMMPLDTSGYNFTNFQIQTVTLPVGLNWQCSNYANGCNYDPWVNQYGCVHISGTPLLAGFYAIDVTVIADLTIASGIPVHFTIYIDIQPAAANTSNNGFSMTGYTGCAPITVNFTNNNPGLESYSWNFGNTNMSSAENPAPQVYTNPGNYVVHYVAYADTTTQNFYTLTSIDVTNLANSFTWGWPTEGNPDVYVIVKDNGSPVYTSTYTQDTYPPVSWTGLNININPTHTYTLEVWDADVYEVIYGGDDLCGTHTMMLTGCTGCAANIATVNYTINHTVVPPTPSVITDDTIHVFGYPGQPNIVYDSLNHTLHTDSTQYSLQWYFNGSPQLGETGATDTVWISGDYFVIAINANGCAAFSDTVTAIWCDPNHHPPVTQSPTSLSTIDTTGNTLQWFLNGNPIAGATSDQVNVLTNGNGVYTVEVTNAFGCTFTSWPLAVDMGITENGMENVRVYPNPATDELHIEGFSGDHETLIISDLVGQELFSQQLNDNSAVVSLSKFSSGVYFVSVVKDNTVVSRVKFVKE